MIRCCLHDAVVTKIVYESDAFLKLSIEDSGNREIDLLFSDIEQMVIEPLSFDLDLFEKGDGEIIKCSVDEITRHVEIVIIWSWYNPLKTETIVLDFNCSHIGEIINSK